MQYQITDTFYMLSVTLALGMFLIKTLLHSSAVVHLGAQRQSETLIPTLNPEINISFS